MFEIVYMLPREKNKCFKIHCKKADKKFADINHAWFVWQLQLWTKINLDTVFVLLISDWLYRITEVAVLVLNCISIYPGFVAVLELLWLFWCLFLLSLVVTFSNT